MMTLTFLYLDVNVSYAGGVDKAQALLGRQQGFDDLQNGLASLATWHVAEDSPGEAPQHSLIQILWAICGPQDNNSFPVAAA